MRISSFFFFTLLISLCFYSCNNKTGYLGKSDSHDSVRIELDSFCYIYDRDLFEMITDSFPQLSGLKDGIIESPDTIYFKYPVFTQGYTFGSEIGQDEFYVLYTYFLRERDQNIDGDVRNNLIRIYRTINSFFGTIESGGTYFGHQYIRIVAYAEYDTYHIYDINKGISPDESNFSVTKAKYLKSLKDRIPHDINYYESEERQEQIMRELHLLINELDKSISDKFYLDRSKEFTEKMYKTL